MKRSRFSEEQIIGILRQAEAGMRVVDLCRRYGISDATLFTSGGQSMAAWMFLTPCACASLRRRTPGSGRWWPSRRWTFPSSRMSLQKTSEARVLKRPCSMFRRHTRPPSGGPVRHRVSTAAVRRPPPQDRDADLRRRLRELAEERRRFGVQRLNVPVSCGRASQRPSDLTSNGEWILSAIVWSLAGVSVS